MKVSRRAALRRVLTGLRSRGWDDQEALAMAVIQELVDPAGRHPTNLSEIVPREFLTRNHVTRDEVATALRELTRDIEIADEGLEPAVLPRLKVLFIAANPEDQSRLRLEEEFRLIQKRLRATEMRDRIDLVPRLATRPDELIDALNEERPQVVHFSGHGSNLSELLFQDDSGRTRLIPLGTVAGIISTVSQDVRLAVFNSCFSSAVAEGVIKHIDAAVGMNDSIDDDTARVFAAQLYSSLGYGLSVARAFDQAVLQVELSSLPGNQIPHLYTREGTRAADITLVAPGNPGRR